jgi:integrase
MVAIPAVPLDPDDLLTEAFEEFQHSRRNKSTHTIAFYHWVLEVQFLPWLRAAGVSAPDQLNTRLITDYLDACKARGLAPGGVRAQQRAIKALVHFWSEPDNFDDGRAWIPPTVRIRFEQLAKPEKLPPMVEPADLKLLLAACETPREEALLLLMVDTGLRRAEVCKLDWGDLELTFGQGQALVREGKRLKDRRVPISDDVLRVVRRYRRQTPHADTDPAFHSERSGEGDGRLSGSGVRGILNRLGKRAGVKVTAHALRRSSATLALRAGRDVAVLQRTLGHSQVSTTIMYLRLDDAAVLEAARKSSPVEFIR